MEWEVARRPVTRPRRRPGRRGRIPPGSSDSWLASAIDTGADPTAFVDRINQATAQRDAARRRPEHVPAVAVVTNDQIAWIVGEVGDLVTELDRGDPARLRNLYEALGVEMTYHHGERVVDVTSDPLAAVVASGRVRGGGAR